MIFRLRTQDQKTVEFEAPANPEALLHVTCQTAPAGAQLEDANGNIIAVRELKHTLMGWTAPWRLADSWWITGGR